MQDCMHFHLWAYNRCSVQSVGRSPAASTLSGQADWLTGVYADSLVLCCGDMLLFWARFQKSQQNKSMILKRSFIFRLDYARRSFRWSLKKIKLNLCTVLWRDWKTTLFVRECVCVFLSASRKGACSACSKSMSPRGNVEPETKSKSDLEEREDSEKDRGSPGQTHFTSPPTSNLSF